MLSQKHNKQKIQTKRLANFKIGLITCWFKLVNE